MKNNFSVIIRCKNEERWIGHTIQSVLDFIPNNEIIIVDNNSSDKSLEIANSFNKDPDLKGNNENYTKVSIYNLSSYSPGKSLNLGVQNCNYDNILIISAHCVIKKFNLKQIVSNLNNFSGIFGNQNPVYLGKRIRKRYLWKHFVEKDIVNMYSEMEERHFFHNAASVFKKKTLLDFPFNEKLVGKEDRYWANNIILNNKKTFYDPLNFEVDHHYTSNGNTWKGVG